jgi:hypothetical protein
VSFPTNPLATILPLSSFVEQIKQWPFGRR